MKRCVLAVILLLSVVFCASGQNSDPIDLVLLLDTSTAMGSSYDKVNDYITGSFLSEFLRTGDTFHLITFSANPRLDIARRISARGDIETIIGRMLIQYPVESGNNAAAAVNYVESYIATLPPRPKKIVMVSAAGPDTSGLINSAKQRLSSKNATFDFVSVTGAVVPGTQNLSNPPGSGRSSPRQSPSQKTPSGTTQPTVPVTPPASSGQGVSGAQPQAQGATQGASQTNQQGTQGASSQTGTQQSQGSTVQAPTDTQSSTQPLGTASTDQEDVTQYQEPSSQDSTRGSYGSETAKSTKQREPISFNPTLPLIIGLIAALLLILIIIFVSRRLGSSPNRVMASVSASPLSPEKEDRFADHSKDLANYAARQSKQRVTPYQDRPIKRNIVNNQPVVINPSGPLLLNLFVEDQNTSIGKRNIHSLKSGYSLTVGGSKSDDFMIFLVPLPSHLGDIRRSGSQLSFIPRRPKYFPDIGTNEVRDCINKRIRIVSDKDYEMWFSFVMYEDPLIALNRVLHSIKVPG